MSKIKNTIKSSLRFIWPPALLIVYAFCQYFALSKNLWANLLALVVTLILLAFALKYQKTKPRKFKHPISKKISLILLAALAIIICLLFFGLAYYYLSNGQIPSSKNQEELQQLAKLGKWHILFEAVFMGPIFEETIFRLGLISFKNKNWTLFTSIFSMISFAGMHMIGTFNIWSMVPYLIISIFLTLLYVYTKDMKCNILLHMLYNLIASVNLL